MIDIVKFAIAIVGVEELSDRLSNVAWLCKGNIVEIGGGEGMNTLRFLPIAREKKTTVIVVDPFKQIEGADESYFRPYTFERFDENLRSKCSEYLLDHLRLIELPSQHVDVPEKLKRWVPIGFMFIDGLQDRESVMSDIRLAVSLNAEVICIDDYDRSTESSQVPVAVDWFRMELTNYRFIYLDKREIYLVRCA